MTDDTFDLGPQARLVARVAERVGDDQLAAPTPCPEFAVRNLLGHLIGLTQAFELAARKDFRPVLDRDPGSVVPDIGPGWRGELPKSLEALVEAWRDPAARQGMTRAGGVDLPGEVAALVVLDELVVHGWDLARATGQEYAPDEASLEGARALLTPADGDDAESGLFGRPVPVPRDAPLLDQVIGMSGRDPRWTAGG
ncbi:TIGR03086 family protein [Streptomyces alfalfae]|uniref:TIGR03086 family protein n=1 Tax=Streptomyces alfalfae TaxID=1642299 RepID=A0A1P8TMY9_9ACTN|nr:TIGR03086 family metal-binding protein [Streptomyces alfalfae]AYA19364.1 TIGR03086 family protein [Streptomyces fradiae]APY88945.1 TIGR03086 family protein [Streptomyces alfalfae]QQC88652.1 TIGR03086 family protein [Streptomyces alfalfae]RXX35631.1 TIGR03086 family protein [Streptomyces alfalfae]RZM81556.1 TIGR03086 family protein [Streptomyces alfalfae]